jgi:hypothetical protein
MRPTTKAISAAATSLCDIGIYIMRSIMERAPTIGATMRKDISTSVLSVARSSGHLDCALDRAGVTTSSHADNLVVHHSKEGRRMTDLGQTGKSRGKQMFSDCRPKADIRSAAKGTRLRYLDIGYSLDELLHFVRRDPAPVRQLMPEPCALALGVTSGVALATLRRLVE